MATVRELKAMFTAETKGIKTAFKQIQQEVAKLSGTTKKTTDDVNKHYNSLTQSTDKLKQVLEETNNVDAFSELTAASERAQNELRETGQVSAAAMDEMEAAVEDAARRFNSLGPEARTSFDVVGRAIEDVNGDLVSLRDTAGRSLDPLTDAQADAAQGFENLGQSAGRMRDSIQAAGQTDTFAELTDAADRAQREIEETGSVTTATMQELRTAVDGSTSHFNSMSTEARSSLSDIENSINWVNDDLGRLELASRNSLNGLSEASQNARQDLNRIGDEAGDLDADLRNLGDDNGLQDVSDDAEELSETLGGLGGAGGIIAGVGGAFLAAAGGVLGFVAAGAGVIGFIKSSDELKQAVNGLQASTGSTNEEMETMRQSLIDIYGNNYGEGYEDVATSIGEVKKALGLTGDELELATTKALLLRDSLGWEVPETMVAVRSMMVNFGYDAETAMNLLVQGEQDGINVAGDLLDVFNEFSGAFDDLGFNGEDAMNMIRSAMDAGAKDASIAADSVNEFATLIRDGSDATKEALTDAGLNSGAILKEFDKGGPAAAAAFQKVTEAVGGIGSKAKQEQVAVSLFGSMAEDAGVQAVLALGDAAGQVDATKDALTAMDSVKYDTVGEAITGLGRKAVANILIPMQDKIMPGVNGAINGTIATIGTLTEAFGAFIRGDESAEDVLMSYGLDPKEFQGVIDALNLIPHALSRIRSGFEAAGQVIKAVWALFKNDDGTAISILSSLGLDKDQMFKVMGAVDAVKSAFKGVVSFISDNIDRMKMLWDSGGSSIFDTIKKVFIDSWPMVKETLATVVGFIGEQLSKILKFWNENGATIMTAVSNLFNGIMAIVKFVMPLVLSVIKMVWTNIKGVITGALDVIMGVVKVFSGLFTGDFGKMWEGLKQMFLGAVTFLWNFVQLTFFGKILGGAKAFVMAFRSGFASMWNAVKSLFTEGGGAALAFLKRAWDEMWMATKTVFTNIGSFLKNTWNSIKSIFTGTINLLKTIISSGFNFIRNTTTTVFSAVWNAIRTVFTTVKNFIQTTVSWLINRFATGFTNIFNTTRTIFTNVWNFLKSIFTTVRNFIQTTISWLINRFITGFTNILNTTKSVFSGVWNFLKTTFTNIKNFLSGSVGDIFTRIKNVWNNIKTTTTRVFGDIFSAIKGRFADIVNAAKALPKRIGDGIGAMASKVTAGVTKVINKLASTLGKGVNGVIGGINWVLGKIGVDEKNYIDKWPVPQYAQGTKHKRGPKGGHPGGPMVVGDGTGSNRGPELIETPDGQQMLSPSKPTLMYGEEGTKVWSAPETKKIMDMVPHYAWGDITDGIRSAGDWASNNVIDPLKDLGGKAISGTKKAAGKVKDLAVNAFDYIKEPGKFLDLALKTLGIEKPKSGDFIGDTAVGGWNKVKSAAVNFVKEKLVGFGATQSGISVTGGNGGGFGSPFRLTSKPGPRNTGIPGASRYHKGWDWGAPAGTPIPSVSDGVGWRAGYHPLSGNYVEVKSGNKVHRYQHNTRNMIRVGQPVRKGQTVGTVGSTGVSSGPHLHYELKGYEKGGIINKEHTALVGEGGKKEAIIPLEQHRSRAIDLWKQTGSALGISEQGMAVLYNEQSEVVQMLRNLGAYIQNQTAELIKQHPVLLQIVAAVGLVVPKVIDVAIGTNEKIEASRNVLAAQNKKSQSEVISKIVEVQTSMKSALAKAENTIVAIASQAVAKANAAMSKAESAMNTAQSAKATAAQSKKQASKPVASKAKASGSSSAESKYFAAVRSDGDWMNDWSTHVPKSRFKSLLLEGFNLAKSLGHSVGKYGRQHLKRLTGYADGGIVDTAQLAWIAEGGWAESIISHDPAKRMSQKAIWEQTGKELGFNTSDPRVIGLLERIAQASENGHSHDIVMSERAVAKAIAPHVKEFQELKGKLKQQKL